MLPLIISPFQYLILSYARLHSNIDYYFRKFAKKITINLYLFFDRQVLASRTYATLSARISKATL